MKTQITLLTVEVFDTIALYLCGLLDRKERQQVRPGLIYTLGESDQLLDASTLWNVNYKADHVITSSLESISWYGFERNGKAVRWRSPVHDDTMLGVPVVTTQDRSIFEGYFLRADSSKGGDNKFVTALVNIFAERIKFKWHECDLPSPHRVHDAVRTREAELMELYSKLRRDQNS